MEQSRIGVDVGDLAEHLSVNSIEIENIDDEVIINK